jgi:methylaspartate ammonia-lyase
MHVMEDGQIAFGECAACSIPARADATPVSRVGFHSVIEQHIRPALVGREADSFRALPKKWKKSRSAESGCIPRSARCHAGDLDAVAKSRRISMCEVFAGEYALLFPKIHPAVHAVRRQRYDNADKIS